MISEWLGPSLLAVLKMIDNGPPKNLIARLQPDAEDHGGVITASDLTTLLEQAEAPDTLLTSLGFQIHKWDAEPATTDWTVGTEASSTARRELICEKLGLDLRGAAVLLEKRPIFADKNVVITAPWDPWYTPQRANSRSFYWPHYKDYLLTVRKWPEDNITSLDLATTSVIERLGDPTRVEANQAKGLVVGYVQSGKTANFTGVIAKALDAGYRLVIVMTGTIEMLRSQTQRRIDMEMVGKQNIVADLTPEQARAANVDYQDDPDWDEGFIDLGADPIVSEIQRLTSHSLDYKKQFKNLKIQRHDMSKPLYDPTNLFSTDARLVVTKKNATVLKKLVDDLQANKTAFAEIPVLIIDDESDQASVNTVNPETVRQAKSEGREVKERRAINERIAQMLTLMPRAQYVGYTATPFANVFVDPSDEQGIYPKDFLISLPQPAGYMGVEHFHDLHDDGDAPLTYETSNYKAYIRDLRATEDDCDVDAREAELANAIDMFVLTGACKLFRANKSKELKFRHHTMLIHESVRTEQQKDLADTVQALWTAASFSTTTGLRRLRALYENDVLPVSAARRESGTPELPAFDELKHWLAKAIGRITEHNNNPVLVVNSDTAIQQQQQQLDFDRHDTWRILVGGAKLSRGFTVEGLTVTYFRRAVRMSDSLTQMGRWFGFRQGYRDLVRVFIDRDAKFGARRVDLYKAFEAVALDEAAFREQLAVYAEWEGDRPKVLPSQVPPLVSQHLPWLLPTARNKMFNAALDEQSDPVLSPTGYPNHVDTQFANLELWRPWLAASNAEVAFPAAGQRTLTAFTGTIGSKEFVDLVGKMEWMYFYGARSVNPKLNYLRRVIKEKPTLLKDFLIVAPQPGDKIVNIAQVGNRRIINRDRRARGADVVPKFGEITDPKHRNLVRPLLSLNKPVGQPLAEYWSPDRGVILLYLMREQQPGFDSKPKPDIAQSNPERGLILTFSMYLPHAAAEGDSVLKFRVLSGDDPSVVTVEAGA